jgi:hypothetical protein
MKKTGNRGSRKTVSTTTFSSANLDDCRGCRCPAERQTINRCVLVRRRPWMYATTSGASGWPPADAAAVVTSAPTMKTTARFIDASSIADTTESHASRKHRPLQALYGIGSCQAQVICRAHCAGRNILGPAGMSFSSVNRQDCLQERRSSSRYKSLAVIPIRSDRRPHAQRRQVQRSERRSG